MEINITSLSDDDTIPRGGALDQWAGLYDEVGKRIGVSFRAAQESFQAMKDGGFENVTERILKVPVGPWAKDKRLKTWGRWFQYFILEGLEGFGIRSFTDVLGVRCALLSSRPTLTLCSGDRRTNKLSCSGRTRRRKCISSMCGRRRWT